jgi:CubicO group peptidase (beta-lactamase class C family)
MKRRTFLLSGLGTASFAPVLASVRSGRWESAAEVLADAVSDGTVHAAALHVQQRGEVLSRAFGGSKSTDDLFLTASISKAMSAAGLMTLHDRAGFRLDDPAVKFLPEFTGDGREAITIKQLLTHVSGLPDQLPENDQLRRRHAPLEDFIEAAIKTPLMFTPGSRYQYSSMAILLAAEIAQRISGKGIHTLLDQAIFQPLGMKRSALGLGRFAFEDVIRCQTEMAAVEAGAGDPSTKDWDWNSPYWRNLGSPWGGVHASAPDVAQFLSEFLYPRGKVLSPETAKLMVRNHNSRGLRERGLGFDLGAQLGGRGCSERTFGHTGATGTLAWADPASETICVVLTTLPGGAITPHPRQLVSEKVAAAS